MDPSDIPPQRKRAFTLGLALIVIGALLFLSFFFHIASALGGSADIRPPAAVLFAPIIGIVLIICGGALRTIAARGKAGSGLELDPEQAREDLKPWAQMSGGMVKDAFDAAGIPTHTPKKASPPPPSNVEERLRNLQRLSEEGLITPEEHETKRKEILEQL